MCVCVCVFSPTVTTTLKNLVALYRKIGKMDAAEVLEDLTAARINKEVRFEINIDKQVQFFYTHFGCFYYRITTHQPEQASFPIYLVLNM